MKKIKSYIPSFVLFFIATILALSFQNCSPQGGFQTSTIQKNLACDNGLCIESSSESRSSREPADESIEAPFIAPPGADLSQLYNIVAGSKANCEAAVATHYKKQVTCTMGGGCGVSCGKPSSTCQSANPQHYGICITQNELAASPAFSPSGGGSGSTTPPPPSTLMYNFVAGDKATCEKSITERLGVKSIKCRVGGGCGISCGKASSTCESANPDAFGACVNQEDIAQAKLADAADMMPSQLYNVGAGDQTTCESAIRSNFQVNISCNVGAGCGLSCGKTSETCRSANPSLYGNCFSKVDIEAAKKAASIQHYNFVAGDKATCEASIKSTLGIRAACTLGGGCGVACGMPGALCNSANPRAYGACIPK